MMGDFPSQEIPVDGSAGTPAVPVVAPVVGLVVGVVVGAVVGAAVGFVVGAIVGAIVGVTVGAIVGAVVGTAVGTSVGTMVGTMVASVVSSVVGTAVGSVGGAVGAVVGSAVGSTVGAAVGAVVGAVVGALVETVVDSETAPVVSVMLVVSFWESPSFFLPKAAIVMTMPSTTAMMINTPPHIFNVAFFIINTSYNKNYVLTLKIRIIIPRTKEVRLFRLHRLCSQWFLLEVAMLLWFLQVRQRLLRARQGFL